MFVGTFLPAFMLNLDRSPSRTLSATSPTWWLPSSSTFKVSSRSVVTLRRSITRSCWSCPSWTWRRSWRTRWRRRCLKTCEMSVPPQYLLSTSSVPPQYLLSHRVSYIPRHFLTLSTFPNIYFPNVFFQTFSRYFIWLSFMLILDDLHTFVQLSTIYVYAWYKCNICQHTQNVLCEHCFLWQWDVSNTPGVPHKSPISQNSE